MKTQKNQRAKAAIYSLFALMIVGTLTISFVSAYRGDYTVEGPNCNEERHESMETAFDTPDYSAWYDLMIEDGRHPRVVDVVTESNFETFVNAHVAAQSGDYETARELRAELGLNNGNGPADGTGYKMGQGEGQQMHRNKYVDADNSGLGQGKGRR